MHRWPNYKKHYSPQIEQSLQAFGYGLYCIDYTQDFSGVLDRGSLVQYLHAQGSEHKAIYAMPWTLEILPSWPTPIRLGTTYAHGYTAIARSTDTRFVQSCTQQDHSNSKREMSMRNWVGNCAGVDCPTTQNVSSPRRTRTRVCAYRGLSLSIYVVVAILRLPIPQPRRS